MRQGLGRLGALVVVRRGGVGPPPEGEWASYQPAGVANLPSRLQIQRFLRNQMSRPTVIPAMTPSAIG
jgi:hypothetical protein